MTTIVRDLPTGLVEKAYGRWAHVYDWLCKRLFEPAHVGAAAAANRVGGQILEVGVGTGLMLPRYGAHVHVTGVDVSEAMLEKARTRVKRQHLPNVAALEVADIHVMDHPDACYDAIVLPFVLTLVAAPEQALDNCLRMLKPGGEIIIVSHFRSRHSWIAAFETAVAPLIAGVGLRPDFPVSRVADWCESRGGCVLKEPEGLGALQVYTLLRIVRMPIPERAGLGP